MKYYWWLLYNGMVPELEFSLSLSHNGSGLGRSDYLAEELERVCACVPVGPVDFQCMFIYAMVRDADIFRDGESVQQSLLGVAMHTFAALTIVSEPYVWYVFTRHPNLAILNFHFNNSPRLQRRGSYAIFMLDHTLVGTVIFVKFLQLCGCLVQVGNEGLDISSMLGRDLISW